MPASRPEAVMLSPCFRAKDATPFLKVIPPYVPVTEVSFNVTLKWNSLVSSPSFPATVLETINVPVFFPGLGGVGLSVSVQ